MKLSAKLEGRTVTIRANEKALESGAVLTGVYHHRPRERTFELTIAGQERACVLDRADWSCDDTGRRTARVDRGR